MNRNSFVDLKDSFYQSIFLSPSERNKKTLAQMADDTNSSFNVTSFDSANSENVFLAASMTSKDFRDSILPMDNTNNSNKDSDDSQSTTNSASAISYKQLHDGDADTDRLDHPGSERAADENEDDDDSSNQSSLDIPILNDGNLQLLPGFLSESSQNLLGNDEDDDGDLLVDNSNEKDEFKEEEDSQSNTDSTLDIISQKVFSGVGADSDIISMDTPPLLRPPVRYDNDRVDTESIQSLSGGEAFTRSKDNRLIINSGFEKSASKVDDLLSSSSPHISVSSETDMLRFDIEQGAKGCGGDAQSIDSHMFTMLDKDKSLSTVNNDDVAEQTLVMGSGSVGEDASEGISLASDDGSSQQRVRFQGTTVYIVVFRESFFVKLVKQLLYDESKS